MTPPLVYGPTPTHLEGRQGARYWVRHPFEITGRKEVDDALSSYPLAVFQPHGRDPGHTPLLIGLQGVSAPYQWNGFLVPTLLDMGIACVLFDTPLAGERSLIRDHPGDVVRQVTALAARGVRFTLAIVCSLIEAVSRDVTTVLDLLRDRHGLRDDRVSLFGISLGCLLSAHSFTRDGVGQRLLGVIGHADLPSFARSYTPTFAPLLVSFPGQLISKVLSYCLGHFPLAARDFLTILTQLGSGGDACMAANPMSYVGRVDSSRRARFLVGRDDRLLDPADAKACAGRFPGGECYVVPGMAHGTTNWGPSFVEHVRYFVSTQLGDWKW